jgi:hypothetical protein
MSLTDERCTIYHLSPGGGCGAGVGGSGAGSCVTQKNAASILLAFVCFPVPD